MSDEFDPYRAPQTADLSADTCTQRHSVGTIFRAWFVQLLLAGLLNRFAGVVVALVAGILISGALQLAVIVSAVVAIVAQVAISYFCFRLTVRVNLDYGADRLTKPHKSKIQRDTSYLDGLEQ